MFTTFEGDNTVLLQLTAKNLLTDYKDSFGDLNPIGMVQFVAGQALSVLTERTALRKVADSVLPGRDDDADLLSAQDPAGPVPLAPRASARGAARRLKGGVDAGKDPFSVLVDTR